jgi:hypothetical protein
MPGPRRLILNPTLQLVGAVAEVSRRGVGRARVELSDLRAVRYLLWAATGEGTRSRLSGAAQRELRRAGILIPPAATPRDVWLDARVDLAPASPQDAAGRPAASCVLHRGPGVPARVQRRAATAEPFLPDESILWVARPGARLGLPYTLTPRLARIVAARRGRATLPPHAAAPLRRIGALDDREGAARLRAAWRDRERAWRRDLRTRGHVVLRGLFEPTFLHAMRAYYHAIEREGYLLGGDARRRGAPLLYDEPLTSFLNALLAPLVARLTDERPRPTFSYLRVYDPGAVLRPHRDRPSCRWNVDLVVGGEPAPSRQNAWPLRIEGRGGVHSVRLGLGDGLLYRGERVRHWRRPQPRGRTTVLASLHYGRPARHSSSVS